MKILDINQLNYYTNKLITLCSNSFSLKNHSHTNYATKSTNMNTSLPATAWTGDSIPFSISISVPGATSTNNIDIIPQASTDEQIDAWQGLGYMIGTQSEDSITLKSWGDKPAVDIPITVIVRGD